MLADHHGSGVGQALLDAAIGDAPAYLWRAADNARAAAFSARNGFVLDGTRTVQTFGTERIDAVRMVR